MVAGHVCHHRHVFLTLLLVCAVVITGVTLLLWRIARVAPISDRPTLERARWSLQIRADQPGMITCELELPTEVWRAQRRLTLLISAADGQTWSSTFDTLSRPVGLSVSPALDPTPPAPLVSVQSLAAMQSEGSVATTIGAHLGHFHLPAGTYRARAKLDALESNELLISITGR